VIKDVLDGLKSLLAYFLKERHVKKKEQDEALLALYTAINETKLHIQRQSTRGRDRTAE
jgi:hypothetical protein